MNVSVDTMSASSVIIINFFILRIVKVIREEGRDTVWN